MLTKTEVEIFSNQSSPEGVSRVMNMEKDDIIRMLFAEMKLKNAAYFFLVDNNLMNSFCEYSNSEGKEPGLISKLTSHIELRYRAWANYAAYHCERTKLEIDIYQLLESVITKLYSMKEKKLSRFFDTPAGVDWELDMYVLRKIKKKIYCGHADKK